MPKLMRINTFVIAVCLLMTACAAPQPQKTALPQQKFHQTDLNKYLGKVVAIEQTPSTVLYEYHDLRVDEVAMLAAMYCQDHGNRKAYLENVILYHNNNRRARFYCSSR